jgi:aspartyl/asparaginyl beta-hydroxylase (cupin superfamily)
MHDADAIEIQALKADSFGRIALMRDAAGPFVRRDLRHVLKHKRMYCPQALTPVERRLLRRHSWLRDAWFATGKPVYRFVTRRLLHWEDNEGQGPKP